MKKKISILGSTGSIGTQALEVIDSIDGEFSIYGLAAGSNVERIVEQINKYKPEVVAMKTEKAALELKKLVKNVEILHGREGLELIASNKQNDLVLVSVTGLDGLYPTLAAIESRIDVALANKETLVSAGDVVMKKAKDAGVNIIPVDSEHSAIHQCIKNIKEVNKLIITASGGPFRNKTVEEIKNATVEQTLNHPKWSMGSKITIDSATLMNKGLEVIEAHQLFGIDYDKIQVVVHPQSILHSAIEYLDGSVIGQMGTPSMHIPIQYAMTYPERVKGIKTENFDFITASKLEFEAPNFDKFPCLKLAFEAGKMGKTYPAVLNAVNEEAVYAFLSGKIGFYDISNIVAKSLDVHQPLTNPSLDDIIEVDKRARAFAQDNILQLA